MSIVNIYEKLHALSLTLPEPPAKGGIYQSAKPFGDNLVYISGCGPSIDGVPVQGKLGIDLTLEEGIVAARNCMLNVLAVLEAYTGDLNKIKSAVKITVFVASADTFYGQSKVANGGSGLLVDLLGEEAGTPSRSAIGVNVLPGNMPVEIEALFELESEDYPD